jgi:integrase
MNRENVEDKIRPDAVSEALLLNEKKRARGAGRVFQRQHSKFLWLQYYVNGAQVRISAGTDDPKKAEKILRQKIGEVEAGVHRDTRRITYEGLREALYSDYIVNKRKSLRRDKEGKPHLDKVVRLDGFFSGYRASEIEADLIRKFIREQQGKGLKNGSINRSISALRRMFNLARNDGKIRDIPHFPMVKESRPRQGFFSREQYDALSRALPDRLRLPLAIGYYSGMRLGEVLGLEWSQVDFLAGIIRLRAGETKNDQAREVPIVPQLRVLIEKQYAQRQAGCPYICFRLDRDGHAGKIKGFRKAWYSACVKAGLGAMVPAVDSMDNPVYAPPRGLRGKRKQKMTYEGIIFHDLRRTGARNLVNAGVPEKVAMEIGGWKTRSVFDRYHIVSEQDVVEAGRKLAKFHEEKVGDISGTVGASVKPLQTLQN